ncbi:Uncharacterised protein [Vibrio cholerae]|nr:Uncharacterised protein [Vibrio cholerae]
MKTNLVRRPFVMPKLRISHLLLLFTCCRQE